MRFEREIPVKYQADVCIVGGGPAGCAAAVTAARAGAKVFLAEAGGCFGGLGTRGMVPAFMQFSDGINWNADGFGRELAEMHKEETGIEWSPRGKGFSIKVEVLKRIYDKLMTEAGVDFLFETRLIGAEAEEGIVRAAVFAGKSELFAVEAKIFIDCTGDGLLSVMAGAPYFKGEPKTQEMMPGTLCQLWCNIDWARRPTGPELREILDKAIEEGYFTDPDRHHPGIWRIGDTTGGGNIGHAYGLDGTDEKSLTDALITQRRQLLELRNFYRERISGYENAEMLMTADMMGVRETRRIDCEYNLVVDDFRARAVFDDEIGRYSYPVDIHRDARNKEQYDNFLKEHLEDLRYGVGESYGIPFRTLLPKCTENLLVAGRCVGTDRQMQASIRVMPGCYITGQAAGMAAALAAKKDTALRALPVEELQAALSDVGAFLPNFKK